MRQIVIQIILLLFTLVSCKTSHERSRTEYTQPDSASELINTEAREDPLKLEEASSLRHKIIHKITADIETEPVESAPGEDAADDPAIWYNENDPSRSLVLGSNKISGIYVYDLTGKILQYRRVGRINNIDLRDGFHYNNKSVVLVAGSNRSNNSITLFYIDKETLEFSDSLINIQSGVDEVYGICCYKSLNNDFHVFVNGIGGRIEQWEIIANNGIEAKLLRSFSVNSQPEGMVADDRNAIIYLGVELEGIFKIDANPDGNTGIQKLPGSDTENPNIAYDIEGLALFMHNNNNYLIASSQGNFSFALFKLGTPDCYLTSFRITDGIIDGAEDTDGVEVITAPLNDRFTQGILVVQDGFNTDGNILLNQNFKYVSMGKILEIVDRHK